MNASKILSVKIDWNKDVLLKNEISYVTARVKNCYFIDIDVRFGLGNVSNTGILYNLCSENMSKYVLKIG